MSDRAEQIAGEGTATAAAKAVPSSAPRAGGTVSEHDQIVSLNGDEWEAACSCGWDAPSGFPDIDEAIDAWENHCDVVFMEA